MVGSGAWWREQREEAWYDIYLHNVWRWLIWYSADLIILVADHQHISTNQHTRPAQTSKGVKRWNRIFSNYAAFPAISTFIGRQSKAPTEPGDIGSALTTRSFVVSAQRWSKSSSWSLCMLHPSPSRIAVLGLKLHKRTHLYHEYLVHHQCDGVVRVKRTRGSPIVLARGYQWCYVCMLHVCVIVQHSIAMILLCVRKKANPWYLPWYLDLRGTLELWR